MTQYPGFSDPVHEAQTTFRALLTALSHPGLIQPIITPLTPPSGLTAACAAACLSLFDLETMVWLSPNIDPEIQAWLQFHTGCPLTGDSQVANFAVIPNINQPNLTQFNLGTAEQPERSTTLLIQLPTLTGGKTIQLKGPGIADQQTVDLPVPESFWQQWQDNIQNYPLGIDIFFLSQDAVIGLPRTTQPMNL